MQGSSTSIDYSLYPYPKSANVNYFVRVLLNSKNFLVWESQIMKMVDSHGFGCFLDGSIVAHPKTIIVLSLDNSIQVVLNPDYQLWNKSDWLLKGWISITLDDEILPFVDELST